MPHPDSEAALEAATMALLADLGYETLNAEREQIGAGSITGRERMDEVILRDRLEAALYRLNPGLPAAAIREALGILTADLSLKTPAEANREIYHLLKDGVRVTFRDPAGVEAVERVAVIDWNNPTQNNWLAVQQFWVLGLNGLYRRRADIILFVNGLPLVFIELKASHKHVENAYAGNLSDYKDTIPHLFWYNALIILSNGRYGRVGSVTASWEYFSEWKRVNSEGEEGRISLETLLLGTCHPARLLDLVENFTLFELSRGRLNKIIARNHQFLGVNAAIDALQTAHPARHLGVFWHTQGSGKSYSMIFFAQKIRRKLPGNWTFVIVTDREELDDQIYDNFAGVGVVAAAQGGRRPGQARSSRELQKMLTEDHTYIFTLIQKFRAEKVQPYPVLSERSNIIVMTDEAHRSQYDIFAGNMRRALPNAGFIGFTGTPLMAGEEKTRQEFGDYVSVYDFKQSVEDGATVPLFYENRIPRLQLTNADLNADMEAVLEAAALDDEQEAALEREFRREYHLITRKDRLESIAADIVAHYSERGFAGREFHSKAMVVCIDKLTALKMLHLVREGWAARIAELEADYQATGAPELAARLAFMRETDMALVISQQQGEIELFRKHGFDIAPHRQRLVTEALDEKFKKPEDPLRLVFVCAMWMTGFDAPSCATVYLDKPMRNHTLMQTIARANRVYGSKQDGLIVDYIGVFRDLEKALAIYGQGTGATGEPPIQPKDARIEQLRALMSEALAFCEGLGIRLEEIDAATGFDREALKAAAIEAILGGEDIRTRFFTYTRDINRLYKSILPDPRADEFSRPRYLLLVLAESVTSEVPTLALDDVQAEVSALLDESVMPETYTITGGARQDISRFDFDALRAQFQAGYQRTAIEKLRGNIAARLEGMLRRNRTRMDYQQHFEKLIAEYNAGSAITEVIFEELLQFVRDLDAEEQRGLSEHLSEEELAIFDLLTRPDLSLTEAEREQIKQGAKHLLETLKQGKLTLDWRKHQNTRAAVRETIQAALDSILPGHISATVYQQKVIQVYQHVYESYFGEGRSVYPAA